MESKRLVPILVVYHTYYCRWANRLNIYQQQVSVLSPIPHMCQLCILYPLLIMGNLILLVWSLIRPLSSHTVLS